MLAGNDELVSVALAIVFIAVGPSASAQPQYLAQEIQRTMTAQCVISGLSGNGDPTSIVKVCECVCSTLTSNLTANEIAELAQAERERKPPESIPQIQRLMPKLRDCGKPPNALQSK